MTEEKLSEKELCESYVKEYEEDVKAFEKQRKILLLLRGFLEGHLSLDDDDMPEVMNLVQWYIDDNQAMLDEAQIQLWNYREILEACQ